MSRPPALLVWLMSWVVSMVLALLADMFVDDWVFTYADAVCLAVGAGLGVTVSRLWD